MLDWFRGKKTYLLGISAIITAWTSYLAGVIDLQAAITATFAALGGMTLRNAISNKTPTTPLLFLLAALGLSSCKSFPQVDVTASAFGVTVGVSTKPLAEIIGSAVATVGGAVTGVGAAAAASGGAGSATK